MPGRPGEVWKEVNVDLERRCLLHLVFRLASELDDSLCCIMKSTIMVTSTSTIPTKKLLDEVTRRIVASVKPQRVLLFGSAARKRVSKNIDFDMLVVMREPVHRRQTAQKIYRNLHGTGIAVDIVVATEKDLEEYGQRPGTILKSALQEGRILYEA